MFIYSCFLSRFVAWSKLYDSMAIRIVHHVCNYSILELCHVFFLFMQCSFLTVRNSAASQFYFIRVWNHRSLQQIPYTAKTKRSIFVVIRTSPFLGQFGVNFPIGASFPLIALVSLFLTTIWVLLLCSQMAIIRYFLLVM